MTYLERDLRRLSQVDSLPDFRRLMVALASRCGNLLNQTEIARDISMSQPTVHRYITLLKTTCVLERISAFFVNRTKRLLKTPKIYWNDPGLASFLSRHFNSDSLRLSREAGGISEATVYLHLKALAQLLIPHPHIHNWGTVSGKEVDFVLEWGRNLLAIEVKLSTRVRFTDIKNLRLFLEEYPETSAGILIYNGNEIRKMGEKIIAIPWSALAS